MKKYVALLLLLFTISGCRPKIDKEEVSAEENTKREIPVKYATGFELYKTKDGYELVINDPWPGADKQYRYELVDEKTEPSQIQVPITKLIATSTTHITPLDLLKEQNTLVGFPSTDYISSPSIRSLIDQGEIEDLGVDSSINVERSIELQPDVLMAYGVESASPIYEQIVQAGIPVIYNGDWTEGHPLGKAEWIKVYGALYGKEQEADSIFNAIEKEYNRFKELAIDVTKPKVLAGATYKDTWYLPYGDSWQGKLLADAGGDYIYSDTSGSGSLAYSLETVLSDGQDAEFWIAPGQYTSFSEMQKDLAAYKEFKAFQTGSIFTFSLKRGAKGGVTYYEEASMRPDLVLKDLIKILHPELAQDHELYFFSPLEP